VKIKRYVARNMSEACHLIKQDIGPDAIIVSSRRIRERGLKGFFVPRKIEVTAAVDEDSRESKLQDELGQIKKLINNLPEKLENDPVKGSTSSNQISLETIRNGLLAIDIEPEPVDFLLKNIKEEILTGKADEIKEVLIKRSAAVFKPAVHSYGQPEIIAFVGPPGIGKTTTLAKIGAIFSLFDSFNIGFITIDTYRIGAVEQLQIYGDIIGASVDMVSSPEGLNAAVEKNRDKDIILIDTAGRPSKNTRQIIELKSFLETLENINIYLVINVTAKNKDMVRILNDFKILAYSGLVFTKIDETDSYGAILNAAYLTGLPIVYITDGQNVPDDIEAANPELLAKLVMRDVVFSE